MKKLTNAINKAKQDAVPFLTGQVRRHALQHGWDPEVVANLTLVNEGDKLIAKVPASHADRAFVHEFGDQNNLPTAALRKYANDPTVANQAYSLLLNHHWKQG